MPLSTGCAAQRLLPSSSDAAPGTAPGGLVLLRAAPRRGLARRFGRIELKATDYGFIGIGRMGANMAKRLLDAGFSLTVYDTSSRAVDDLAAHGAQPAASAAEAADSAETLFLSLPTPDIIHTVALGPNGVHEGGRVKQVFDCSTTGPAMA